MLRHILGEWLYWPIVVMAVGVAATALLSNVSLCYTEIRDQLKELWRIKNG